jgi:hypothetical protein
MEDGEAIEAIASKRDEAAGYEVVSISAVWCEDCKAVHVEVRPSVLL